MEDRAMQGRKRRRIAVELELAARAGERATRARRRAEAAEGSAREAHLRAAQLQDVAVQTHEAAADLQRMNLSTEEGPYGRGTGSRPRADAGRRAR